MNMPHTKSLRGLKEALSKHLEIGVSRISFKDAALEKIYDKARTTWTNELVRTLIKEKLIRLKPKATRKYKIYYGKKKALKETLGEKFNPHHKLKNVKSLKYLLKRKIITKKDMWIRKIRALRREAKLKT